jgi:hypothetical protein
MTRRKPAYATIGSVSSLDPEEDPIGDLAYALKSLLKRCRVSRETRKEHVALLQLANAIVVYDQEAASKSESYQYIIFKLKSALNDYAPPYALFDQNREGEYGFWPDIDLHSCDDPARIEAGLKHKEHWGGDDVALVNGHGNVSVGRFDKRGRWHEYWSVV